jgi:hypothetical protein
MREYYDAQVYQQKMELEAEHERQVQAARIANAKPNRFLLSVGAVLVAIGERLQDKTEQDTQQETRRRAYR